MTPELETTIVRETAVGRPGSPYDLAGAVLYLASDAAAFTTGALIRVDGGWI
jgi:NAD(P)-dependent dehydrogenase (short-subunit alcohol dehydrogenase family)